MAAKQVIELRLSACAEEFLALMLDVLQAIENSDPMLVTDEILEAEQRAAEYVQAHRGEL